MLGAATTGAAALSRRSHFALNAIRNTALSRSQPRFIRQETGSAYYFRFLKQSDRPYTSQAGMTEEDSRDALELGDQLKPGVNDISSQINPSSFLRSQSKSSEDPNLKKDNEVRERTLPSADSKSRLGRDSVQDRGGEVTDSGSLDGVSDGVLDGSSDGIPDGVLDGVLDGVASALDF